MIAHIVTTALAVAAALNLAATARAETVAVRIVPPFALERYAEAGAVGLLVPGSGASVSREAALAALRTGKTRPSKLNEIPSGPDRLDGAFGRRAADVTILVSLPPPGKHPNDRRYPIAVVGPGYHGLLTSSRTRIPGLVSVADVAPTVEALQCGGDSGCDQPTIRSRPDDDAPATLRSLDRRFDRLHSARLWARIVIFSAMLALAAAALRFRSVRLARAALLAPALVLAAALGLSALGEARALVTAVVLSLAALAAIPAARLPLGWVFAVLLAAFTVVLVAWPAVPALAALAPHPEGGGRFYGLTNTTETILLAPALVAGGALGPLWIGLLAAATTIAGVDGGGLVVVFAAFIVLALLLGRRYQAAGLALIGGLGALALLIAGGSRDLGSNHINDAASGGAGGIVDSLTRRWHLSWVSITGAPLSLVLFLGCLAALVAVGRSRPRSAVLDALLVAIAVSLVFNDSPNDVIRFGAAAAATVWAWQRVLRHAPEADR